MKLIDRSGEEWWLIIVNLVREVRLVVDSSRDPVRDGEKDFPSHCLPTRENCEASLAKD